MKVSPLILIDGEPIDAVPKIWWRPSLLGPMHWSDSEFSPLGSKHGPIEVLRCSAKVTAGMCCLLASSLAGEGKAAGRDLNSMV